MVRGGPQRLLVFAGVELRIRRTSEEDDLSTQVTPPTALPVNERVSSASGSLGYNITTERWVSGIQSLFRSLFQRFPSFLFNHSVQFFDEAHLPDLVVNILSILLSLFYFLWKYVIDAILVLNSNEETSTIMLRLSSNAGTADQLFVWVFPVLCSLFSFTLCLAMFMQSMFNSNSTHDSTAAIGISVLLLFEATVPLVMASATWWGQFWNNQHALWVLILILIIVAKLATHVLRQAIYPQLGHD